MRNIAILICTLAGISTASPAWAITDAYVLIETAPDKVGAVMNSSWGFGNCKALVHRFQSNEIIALLPATTWPASTRLSVKIFLRRKGSRA